MKRGFTIIEIMIIVVVISILVGLALPLYNRTMERARDNAATTSLQLIQAAEKIYRLEDPNGNYYGPTTGSTDPIGDINTNLRLELNPTDWVYTISNVTTGPPTFTAQATRQGGTRTWQIDQVANQAQCTTDCL